MQSDTMSEPFYEWLEEIDHQFTLAEWAKRLLESSPEEYAEPPAPAEESLALSQEARVTLLSRRFRRGEALWHPNDLIHTECGLGLTVAVRRNGVPVTTGVVCG